MAESIKSMVKSHLLGFVAGLSVLVAGLLVITSLIGFPSSYPEAEEPAQEIFSEKSAISLRAGFDSSSKFIGEEIVYTVRVTWRPGLVAPDVGSVRKTIDFAPFDEKSSRFYERNIAPGLSEYVFEYLIQAVEVEPHTGYQFPDITLSFSHTFSGDKSEITITPPLLYVTGYYPEDVSGIPLQPLKGKVEDFASAKYVLLSVGIGLLFLTSLLSLWRLGRKKFVGELSEIERLYLEFYGLRHQELDARRYLLRCEGIFIRLLQMRTGLGFREFWLGINPEDSFWSDLAVQARHVFCAAYDDPQAELERQTVAAHDLLSKAFLSLVPVMAIEENLRAYRTGGFIDRLLSRPKALAVRAMLLSAAIALIVLVVAIPSIWFSSDIPVYNKAVEDGVYWEFRGAAEHVNDPVIKAALFYNAGTLLAGKSVTLYDLQLAESALKDAVRSNPNDIDARKNLELVIQRRKAMERNLAEQRLPPSGEPTIPKPSGYPLGASEDDY